MNYLPLLTISARSTISRAAGQLAALRYRPAMSRAAVWDSANRYARCSPNTLVDINSGA